MSTETVLFLNPAKSLNLLVEEEISSEQGCKILVSLKGTRYAMQYDGTTYFDPRELRRIAKQGRL